MSSSENLYDVSQVVHDECGHLRDVFFVDSPTVEQHGIKAGSEGTEDVALQIIANHQGRFTAGPSYLDGLLETEWGRLVPASILAQDNGVEVVTQTAGI